MNKCHSYAVTEDGGALPNSMFVEASASIYVGLLTLVAPTDPEPLDRLNQEFGAWFQEVVMLDVPQEEKERAARTLSFVRGAFREMPLMAAREFRRAVLRILKKVGKRQRQFLDYTPELANPASEAIPTAAEFLGV